MGTRARLSRMALPAAAAAGVGGAGFVLGRGLGRRRLLQALERAVRAEELRREFLSVAAHELRGPLAVVHGVAATLQARHDELPGDQQARLRELLFEQSCRVRELTEQLLDLSRLEAGRLRVERAPLRPRQVLEELLPRVTADHEGQVELLIDPAQEVVSDRTAFERVVGNLVTNALKYGQPPVLVQADARERSVDVVVEDHGAGVSPEFVPLLFERFTRSDETVRAGPSGAGLGLAIAQRYADAVGAELRYERGRNGGARFVYSLPRA